MFGAAPTAQLTAASIFNTLMECTLDHFYELWSTVGIVEGGQSSCWSAILGIQRHSLDRLLRKPGARTPLFSGLMHQRMAGDGSTFKLA